MSVTINGTSGISATNISGIVDLINTGNTTLGNDSSDVITINGGTVNLTATNAKISNAAGDSLTPYAGFKNKIINGNFDFWQRDTSQTATGYGSDDRWHNGNVGSTKTHSRQAFALGQTAVPNNPQFFSRTVVTSVANAVNQVSKYQTIENVTFSSGKTMTLSFWAKADASKNIAVDFFQQFGTGGSPSSAVVFAPTTYALTTSWKKFTTTVTYPSVAGKTVGTDGNHSYGLHFWFDAGSSFNARTNSLGQQSGTFDIAQVQLEEGSVATPFETRPQQVELALCQRYYQMMWSNIYAEGYAAGANNGVCIAMLTLPVAMRVSPTVGLPSVAASNATGSLGLATIHNGLIGLLMNAAGPGRFFWYTTSATTLSAEL
jgi:hypothetical protein